MMRLASTDSLLTRSIFATIFLIVSSVGLGQRNPVIPKWFGMSGPYSGPTFAELSLPNKEISSAWLLPKPPRKLGNDYGLSYLGYLDTISSYLSGHLDSFIKLYLVSKPAIAFDEYREAVAASAILLKSTPGAKLSSAAYADAVLYRNSSRLGGGVGPMAYLLLSQSYVCEGSFANGRPSAESCAKKVPEILAIQSYNAYLHESRSLGTYDYKGVLVAPGDIDIEGALRIRLKIAHKWPEDGKNAVALARDYLRLNRINEASDVAKAYLSLYPSGNGMKSDLQRIISQASKR